MKYWLLLIGLLSTVSLSAQVGVFRTYEDFVAGRIETYAKFVSTNHAAGNFKVVFKDKGGQKVKFNLNKEKIWGYVDDLKKIYRINDKKQPCVVFEVGEIVLYGNYSTSFNPEGEVVMNLNQFGAYASQGLGEPMVKLTKKNILSFYPKGSKQYNYLKSCSKVTEPLVECIVEFNKQAEKKK